MSITTLTVKGRREKQITSNGVDDLGRHYVSASALRRALNWAQDGVYDSPIVILDKDGKGVDVNPTGNL